MKEEIEKAFELGALHRINKKVFIRQWHKEMFDKYEIPYNNVHTMKDLIFYINKLIDDNDFDADELEKLEELANEISEIDYYIETHR